MMISEKAKKIIRRVFRITLTAVLILLGIIVLIIFLIQTSPVQNYARGKIEVYLENKLHTKVRIGNIYIGLPTKVTLKNIYVEDQRKDTLLYGGNIEVKINMLRLFRKEVMVSNILLDDLTLKVKRRLPDSVLNFQFIADAFSSRPSTKKDTDTSGGFRFVIGTLQLHHIHAVYNDDATGTDLWVNLGAFETKIKTFDPAHQSYAITNITLSDVSGNFRQYKPILLFQQVADTIQVHNKKSDPVKLELGTIDFTKIHLDYRNDANNMDAAIQLGSFHTLADSINLETLHFKLNQIMLNATSARMHFGKVPFVQNKKNDAPANALTRKINWAIDVASFTIDSTRLQYDDDNKKPVKKGIDYNHLLVNNLMVNTTQLHADPDNDQVIISRIALEEKSGFVLKKLSTQGSYNTKGITLKDLIIQTNHSDIRSETAIHYRSADDLKKNPGSIETNLQFNKTRIGIADVLVFVPSLEGPFKGNLQAVLSLNGKISGRLNNLQIPYLEVEGIGNTALAASGKIIGLPNAKKAQYDIVLNKLKTTRTDIFRFVPAKSFPENLRLPESLSAQGKFTGTFKRFYVQLHAVTSNGVADIHGNLNLEQKTYDLIARTSSLDLGYLFKQDSVLGKITLNASAKGSGFDPKKMNSVFHVGLDEVFFKSYAYHGLLLDAQLQNGNASISSSMDEANVVFHLNGEANLLNRYPGVKLKLQIDTVNLQALNLVGDSLQMHGIVDADFSSTNPDSLQGRLNMSDLKWTINSQSFQTDSVGILANHSDTGQSIRLHSEVADLNWAGKYKITQTADVLKKFLQHYYKTPVLDTAKTDAQHWNLSVLLKPSPLVLAMIPSLKGSDSVAGNITFNSEKKDLQVHLNADKIQFNNQIIHLLDIHSQSQDTAINYSISAADAGKPGFQLYQTAIYGSVANNKLNTTIHLRDKKLKSNYILSGVLSQVHHGIKFVFNPDSLLLNYDRWSLPAENYIQYDSAGIIVRNLKLQHGNEAIEINSKVVSPTAPIDVRFEHFRIQTLMDFAAQDSVLLDGTINGNAEVKNILSKPLFTSDLTIDSLAYKRDTVGNLTIKVSNDELNAFIAKIGLHGNGNDVQIDGKYFSGESKMDLTVLLNQLNLSTVKSAVASQIGSMSGYLKGTLHASGNLEQPVLKGALHFENAVITPVISGEPLKLSNDAVSFDDDGFNFDNFTLLDSAGNKATLDGNVFTKDFKNYTFDMTLNAQNFRLVNAPKEPNRQFYGKLNLNADADVTGDLNLPKVTAILRVNKNTDFFVIFPSDNPEVVDREGVVVFTNNIHQTDSVKMKSLLDSLSASARLRGMDVSATIETDSSAQFTLVLDERNGDALAIRGRGELTGGIDKSGKVSLTGNYELVNGAYNLTLSVLHRKFDIQRGSVITWTGDPTKANIDITAIYTVNTAPIDLMEQQLSRQSSNDVTRYKQRLPFQVKLVMTGELLKPQIKFDIALPDNLLSLWPDVDTKLQQMRTDDAEINKQVFALLLLGRFVQENPFQSAGAGTDAGTIARQSASKILSDQLNQLAGSLVKGVDVNFDLNSNQDFSTGTAQNQTDLKVKVSKNLFDERVRVTVGSDFQLEQTNPGQNTSNIAGDVNVDYKLSKDGRYMIRVYRKDQYETIVQGQVVETGVSFILTFDYNKFRELFENKKETPLVPLKDHHKATPAKNLPAQ